MRQEKIKCLTIKRLEEMKKRKMTLEQFADLINKSDEWKSSFVQIIKDNGWTDLTHEMWKVCSDGQNVIYFDDKFIAQIKAI